MTRLTKIFKRNLKLNNIEEKNKQKMMNKQQTLNAMICKSKYVNFLPK